MNSITQLGSCCRALQQLEIRRYGALPCDALQVLAECEELRKLALIDNDQRQDVPNIQLYLLKLEAIKLRCKNLSNIAPLGLCTALRELSISHCLLSNKAFELLTSCTVLERLDISYCPQLRDVPNLQRCSDLEAVSLYDCQKLSNLAPLGLCPALRDQSIRGCSLSNRAFEDLASCTALEGLGNQPLSQATRFSQPPSLSQTRNRQVLLSQGAAQYLRMVQMLRSAPADLV
eukprot:gene30674-35695_t